MKVLIDCLIYSESSNFGFRESIRSLLLELCNYSGHAKFYFLFKKSEKYNIEKFCLKYDIKAKCVFLDDFAWRFKAWFLNFFIDSSFKILINTYNQGVLFPRKTLVVTIVHDHLFLTKFHEFGIRKLYYNLIFRNPFTRPKNCIFISNTTRYEHLKFFKQPKSSEVIYWPTPKKKFQKKKSVREIREGEVFFLNIASKGRYKNTDYLLREFETFKKNNMGVKLVLVGREGKNENNTFYFKNLPQDELNWLLDKCTAIILPSHYEGFGLPYQEAKIFSKKMLVYDMPVSREFCDKYLTTFILNYKGQLSYQMSKIIENKDNNIKIEDKGYNYNNKYFEKLEAFLKRAEREK